MPFARSISNVNFFPQEYFSGADVSLYVGSTRLASVSAISYTVSEQILPIYGYASRTWNDIAHGTRIVAGQIMVPYSGPEGLLGQVAGIVPDAARLAFEDPEIAPGALRSSVRSAAQRLQSRFWGSPAPDVPERPFFPETPIRIHIRFGDDPGKDRTLVDVHLQSLGGSADPSGEPVMEVYAFQARDLA